MRPFLLTLILGAALALPAAAAASPSQFTIFEAPRELMSDDAALRTQTLDEIQGFGVQWLRVVMYWNSVAPDHDSATVPRFDETDPAQYPGFGRYDRIISEARARGMRVLLTVTGPVPRWATHDRRDHVTRPSPTRFGRFMTAVGRRYGDEVRFYAIWNEPNHPDFLMPQYTGSRRHRVAASPGIYRKLAFAGVEGLERAGVPGSKVLLGETAPRGTSHVVSPLRFVRGALCLDSHDRKRRGCHELRVHGWAHHAYTPAAGPFYVPPQPGDVTIGVLGRLERVLSRAGATHAIPRGIGIYLTEFGIQSRPDPYMGVSYTAQAEFRSISERIAYRDGHVRAFSQYLMRDDDPRAASGPERYGGFESGLRTSGGAAKLAYDGFRLPLVAILGHRRTSLWGLVRAAHGRARVSIDFRSRHGRQWHFLKHDTTNARGYWSTTTRQVAGRRYRVRWVSPDGGRYYGPLTRSYRSP